MTKTTTLASVGLIASMDDLTKKNPLNFEPTAGFSLKIFATSWGYVGSIDSFCAKAKSEGYEGIEVWWETTKKVKMNYFLP